MKILLVANYPPDRQESMLRYAGMLERGLGARGHQVTVIHPPERLTKLLGRGGPLGKWIAYVDKYLLAPSYLRARIRRAQADVVHICDHSNSMYVKLAGATPSVITCHDLLAVFAAQGRFAGITVGGTGRLLQRWIASGLVRAPFVICVSRKTQEDLREEAGRQGRKAQSSSVIYHPLNWDFHPVPVDESRAVFVARGLPAVGRYFIHVGSNSWYKNRPAAVRIFAALKQTERFQDARLILAGKPWSAELRGVVEASGVAADVIELNGVSNEELRALYSGAVALLFPSRYEGFGWPLLEAQACGCAVVTTDKAPMTEVAGGAAVLIDPEQPELAAGVILAAYERLPALREAGFEHVKLFSEDRSIRGYLAAYDAAIAEQS